MKIAHIAPPWITIPPENYSGTEIVIYYLVEKQVAQGHEVTLFAPGDAKTSAPLISKPGTTVMRQPGEAEEDAPTTTDDRAATDTLQMSPRRLSFVRQ